MTEEHLKKYIKKYLEGRCTEAEKALVETWYNNYDHSAYHLQIRAKKLKKIITVAAIVLLILTTGVYCFYKTIFPGIRGSTVKKLTTISAGHNQAILLTADGKKLNLSGKFPGIIIGKTNISYINNQNHSIKISRGLNAMTVITPRGGQYQVILPDGTKVWINADSKLSVGDRFGIDNRIVQLTGEAYFEVSNHAISPFKVLSAGQEIVVLGTSFNISSYDGENEITSLLKGSIKVHSASGAILLNPGEQTTNKNGLIHRQTIGSNRVNAWKDGKFVFQNESIYRIMKKIERWYNVDIEFKGSFPNDTFGGSISRFSDITEVLKMLELTGQVHFEIDSNNGGKIEVIPSK
ncbi:FecR family protein [bacterium A37T11]|nr:FecR family protein [bacterium A37T11]